MAKFVCDMATAYAGRDVRDQVHKLGRMPDMVVYPESESQVMTIVDGQSKAHGVSLISVRRRQPTSRTRCGATSASKRTIVFRRHAAE
jgi:hypothetical protein